MKRHILILTGLLCALVSMAVNPVKEGNIITGHVIEKNTEEGLPYATVLIVETGVGMATDAEGYFRFKNVPAGEYTLKVQSMGYSTQTKRVTVGNDFTVDMHFVMEEETIMTDEVVVSTDGGEARSNLILLPPEPVLVSLSNTMPEVGETIVIEGEYLFYVQEVLFPGRRNFSVTDFVVSDDGSQIEVTVPEGYDPSKGDIQVVTLSGEASITPDVPEVPEEPLPDEPLTITELKYLPEVSYAPWEVKENLQEGDLVYVDRTTMSFSEIPDFYKGSLWISTAVDSRGYINEAEPLVSFRVNRTCDVYIAYNKGTVGWVKWLQDGTWTRMEIDAEQSLHEEIKVVSTQFPDGDPDTYDLYKKRFEAGVIELQANSNQKNTRSPYFVILK